MPPAEKGQALACLQAAMVGLVSLWTSLQSCAQTGVLTYNICCRHSSTLYLQNTLSGEVGAVLQNTG